MARKKKSNFLNQVIGVVLAVVIISYLGKQGVAVVTHHSGAPSASGPCSGLGSVPASEINGAAQALGISCRIVRAQINEESGGQDETSPAGAQGVAQFEPYTWADQHCPGSVHNQADSMHCYVQYMGELIRQEGSVRDALAAYNAGSGNLGAGMGYADTILAAAGQ